MKKILLLALAVCLIAGAATAAVVGSKHDLKTLIGDEGTTQVCVFCHHPHRGATSKAEDSLLWNIQVDATGPFATYTSTTMDAVDAGTAVDSSVAYSFLCMACHDGALAADQMITAAKDGGWGTAWSSVVPDDLGTTLADDHPVNFTYDAALASADGGLATPVSGVVAGIYKLYSDTMQCATCHDVHKGDNVDNATLQFLRDDDTNSALTDSAMCTNCHTNK